MRKRRQQINENGFFWELGLGGENIFHVCVSTVVVIAYLEMTERSMTTEI